MRFGVEIELDDLDGRDFGLRPLLQGEMPSGIDEVKKLIEGLGLEVHVHTWKHNHNNSIWACKPDSSCGIEICSPVMEDSEIETLTAVVDALNRRKDFTTGENCSVHVHVDVSHLVESKFINSEPLSSVLSWWIKSEAVMFDSVPDRRRNSKFCRCIGLTDTVSHDEVLISSIMISRLSNKYFSLNTHHMFFGKRNSIEFRLMEGTKNSFDIQMWVRLILRFVESTSHLKRPNDLKWIDLDEVCKIISAPDLEDWLRLRIALNSKDESSSFFWKDRLIREYSDSSLLVSFGQSSSII